MFRKCLAPNTDGDGSGCDNMTCILIQFKKDGSRPTVVKRTLADAEESSVTADAGQEKGKEHSDYEVTNKKVKAENDDVSVVTTTAEATKGVDNDDDQPKPDTSAAEDHK